MNKAANAVLVSVIEPHGIAGLRKSLDAHTLFQLSQNPVGGETRGFRGLAGITRAKLLTSFAGRAPQLHHHVVCVRDEIFANVDNVCFRYTQSQPRRHSFASIRNPCGSFWNFTT
jgi:hypothetical protein